MNILQLLGEADYIQVNNQLIKPDFLPAEEDCVDDEDIALAAHLDSGDLVLTVADLEEAKPLADGGYWLEGVGYLRFVSRQQLH